MNIAARKRVYWFYLIIGILFLFFYLLVLENMPYQVNYGYSDIIMRKLLNAPRFMKVCLVYFFMVISTSFIGYIISSIIKDPSYQKSFLVSFAVSFVVGIIILVSYLLV